MKSVTFEQYKERKKKMKRVGFMQFPSFNYDVADLYAEEWDNSEWLIFCIWFWGLYESRDKFKATKRVIDGTEYIWVSYKLVVQRLFVLGFRNMETISRWITRLSNPIGDNQKPALLKKYLGTSPYDDVSAVYLAPTDALKALCSHNPEAVDAYMIGDDYIDNTVPAEAPIEEKKKDPPKEFQFPEWWDVYWAKVTSLGHKYTDNVYKKNTSTVNKYIIKTVDAIQSLFDGTYYSTIGKDHIVKYDLSKLTMEMLLKGLEDCWMPDEGDAVYGVLCPFSIDRKMKKSRLLDVIFTGSSFPDTSKPASSKPLTQKIKPSSREEIKTFFKGRVRAPDTLNFIWNESSSPAKYYPELVEDSPFYWGIYFKVAEEHDANYCVDKDNPSKSGLWSRNNPLKGVVSVQTLVNTILMCAKSAGFTFEELMSYLVVGKDDNYIWVLTMQWVYNNKSEVRLGNHLTENAAKFIYSTMKLTANSFYTGYPDRLKVVEKKGAKE
jgi:hypothetical protein